MTAKKKELIELMLDVGITPEEIDNKTKFFVSDEPSFDGSTAISEYYKKPKFNKSGNDWLYDGFVNYISFTPCHPKNWKRTVVTKDQFIAAYNERNKKQYEYISQQSDVGKKLIHENVAMIVVSSEAVGDCVGGFQVNNKAVQCESGDIYSAEWPSESDIDVVAQNGEVEETVINKYSKEIKPNVFVDVYDVLKAWGVTNPALQHLIKKALQPGDRGHKTLEQDIDDIIASAKRAKELL